MYRWLAGLNWTGLAWDWELRERNFFDLLCFAKRRMWFRSQKETRPRELQADDGPNSRLASPVQARPARPRPYFIWPTQKMMFVYRRFLFERHEQSEKGKERKVSNIEPSRVKSSRPAINIDCLSNLLNARASKGSKYRAVWWRVEMNENGTD